MDWRDGCSMLHARLVDDDPDMCAHSCNRDFHTSSHHKCVEITQRHIRCIAGYICYRHIAGFTQGNCPS